MATKKSITQPTVTTKLEGCPSFFQVTKTRRGRYVSDNLFAVRPNSYGHGWTDGEAAFREFFECLAGQNLHCGRFPDVVKALAAALDERDSCGERSRYGAAVGFCRAIEALLIGMASTPSTLKAIQSKLPSWESIAAREQRDAAMLDRKFQAALCKMVRNGMKAGKEIGNV